MTTREEVRQDGIKVWFNPGFGYRFFTPDGKEIPFVAKSQVTIDDNFDSNNMMASANITFLCEVVNEKPANVE